MLKGFLFSLLLLIFGCSKDKTFKRVLQKEEVGKFHFFTLLATDKNLKLLTLKAAKEADIKLSKSPYTIVVESSKYPQHCNNPLTPAYEASYDGYVRITVKKAFKKIYFIQRDFHNDVTKEIIEDLFEIMKDDLKIK